MKLTIRDGLKKYRFKKDVVLYHPHLIVVPEGTILFSEMPPIIGMNRTVMTDDKEIAEYMEEIQ